MGVEIQYSRTIYLPDPDSQLKGGLRILLSTQQTKSTVNLSIISMDKPDYHL